MTEIRKMIDLMSDKKVIARQVSFMEYNYYLTGEIVDFNDYLDLFDVLKNSNSNDMVRIYLDSPGGSVSVGMMIINHIHEALSREVIVVANIGFECASMASAIALSCGEIELHDMSTMMIHGWRGGIFGTAGHLANEADFNKKQSEKYIRLLYSGYLTEDEISKLIDYSVDLNFNADEIEERWENMQSYRQQQIDNMIVEMQAKQEALDNPKPTPKKKSTKSK